MPCIIKSHLLFKWKGDDSPRQGRLIGGILKAIRITLAEALTSVPCIQCKPCCYWKLERNWPSVEWTKSRPANRTRVLKEKYLYDHLGRNKMQEVCENDLSHRTGSRTQNGWGISHHMGHWRVGSVSRALGFGCHSTWRKKIINLLM